MPNRRVHVNIRRLLGYPKSLRRDVIVLAESEFGQPTIRMPSDDLGKQDETVVASKMLYASHYFWTGLELRALVPDSARNSGFWFVTVNRSRSDGLSGFTGTFVRRRVRDEVQDGALAALRQTKRMIERSR
jgi:hypothetical protein